MSPRFLFVGERPSSKALARGWTWRHGRLAAKTLFDALRSAGLDPQAQRYTNVFVAAADVVCPLAVRRIRGASRAGLVVVAMGEKAAAVLARREIPHLVIPHPAARGAVRAKAFYATVVRYALRGAGLKSKPVDRG